MTMERFLELEKKANEMRDVKRTINELQNIKNAIESSNSHLFAIEFYNEDSDSVGSIDDVKADLLKTIIDGLIRDKQQELNKLEQEFRDM